MNNTQTALDRIHTCMVFHKKLGCVAVRKIANPVCVKLFCADHYMCGTRKNLLSKFNTERTRNHLFLGGTLCIMEFGNSKRIVFIRGRL